MTKFAPRTRGRTHRTPTRSLVVSIENATRQHLRLAFFRGLAQETLRILRVREAEVGVRFVTPREMARISGAYRNKPRPTNVLSFAYHEDAPRSFILGDIALCPAIVRSEAKTQGETLEKRLAVLLVHGIVHLAGHAHRKKRDAEKMERLEKRIQKRLGLLELKKSKVPGRTGKNQMPNKENFFIPQILFGI